MLYKYRLWCETESKYVYVWSEDGDNPPTLCPNNTSHTIDTTKTVVVETVSDPKQKSDGTLIVANTFGEIPLNPVWKGVVHPGTAGGESFLDVEITTEIQLQGGSYFIRDADLPNLTPGDYIEFSVIDKNDVLGLFSQHGLTVGTDILELNKFVKTAYLDKSGVFIGKYSAFPVVPGLFFRIGAKIQGTVDVPIYCILYWYE